MRLQSQKINIFRTFLKNDYMPVLPIKSSFIINLLLWNALDLEYSQIHNKINWFCGELFQQNTPITSRCWCCCCWSSLGTSGFSNSLRNSSKLSASPPFLLFLRSSGTSGVRQRVKSYEKKKRDYKVKQTNWKSTTDFYLP